VSGRSLVILSAMLSVCACTTAPREYAGREPHLRLEEYFDGPLVAWGIVQNRSGKVTRSFRVDLKGHWDGPTGVLEEDFEWSDGAVERRVWTFNKVDAHHYTGTAGDVVGEARGEAFGNALRWGYTLAVPWNNRIVNVVLDDWMWLLSDGVLVNRAEIRKFGFRVGDVTVFFQKLERTP
jgi:hypothetical protein